jgi:hypothetical protein
MNNDQYQPNPYQSIGYEQIVEQLTELRNKDALTKEEQLKLELLDQALLLVLSI